MSEWVTIARIVKTQGCRGELGAEIHTDIPERFDSLPQVYLSLPPRPPQAFRMLRHWFHLGRVVLALEGLDMTAAEGWIGAEVQVPRAERPPAPEGAFFVADLIGCAVFDRDRSVGVVTAVDSHPAPLLHLADAAGREVLVPFVEAYRPRVDLAARRIDLDLPEGLLEINAGSGGEQTAQRRRKAGS